MTKVEWVFRPLKLLLLSGCNQSIKYLQMVSMLKHRVRIFIAFESILAGAVIIKGWRVLTNNFSSLAVVDEDDQTTVLFS